MELTLSDNDFLDAIRRPVIEINPKFIQLGQDLLNGVKDWLDFSGLARKVFAPRTLKSGEVCRYEKDKERPAYQINGDREAVKRGEGSKHIYPDEFEVCVYPKLPLKLQELHLDASMASMKGEVELLQEKARYDIQQQEDTAMIKLLKEAGKENQKVKSNPYDILTSLITEFNPRKLICDKILLNRKDVEFIKNNDDRFKDKLDFVSQSELAKAGYVGTYMNTLLVTIPEGVEEDLIPYGEPIALASPEYLGGMPIRVNFFSEPCSESDSEKSQYGNYGWFWYELISMIIINTNAVVLGGINY